VESLEMLAPIPDRKALLVFSDGEDQGSRTSMDGALDAARRSLASVYAVGLLGWSTKAGMSTNQTLLEQIADFTGGRAFFPRKPKEMQKAFDRIREELHQQYRMGYVPQGRGQESDGWREIEVKLTRRPELGARSRVGYFRGGR
jgi:VWFA-related protein